MALDVAKQPTAFRGAFLENVQAAWLIVAKVGFAILIPAMLLGRVEMTPALSFSYRSFSRNVAIFVLVGAVLRVRGLQLTRSTLTAPMLAFVAAAACSVWVNHGLLGDVRTFAAAIGLFFAARALASTEEGRRWLFCWLGALSIAVLLMEIAANPRVLTLRESYREGLVGMHANTMGEAFALLSPIFLADALTRRRAALSWLFFACTLLGLSIAYSRAAWIATLLGTLIVVLAVRAERSLTLLRTLAVAGVIAAAAASLIYLSLGRTEADQQRLRILETSLTLFREQPWFGVGFGIANLQKHFPARYIELFGEGLFLFHSHNVYVDLLTGTGLIGALVGGWLLFALAARAVHVVTRVAAGAERLRALSYAVSVGLTLLLGMTDSIFYNSHLMIILAVVWALMDVGEAPTRG